MAGLCSMIYNLGMSHSLYLVINVSFALLALLCATNAVVSSYLLMLMLMPSRSFGRVAAADPILCLAVRPFT
jgi:hypothetical protein